MQVIEIKPSNNLIFKLPHHLSTKFIIGNLTLRTVCIYIINIHPELVSVNQQNFYLDAFQEIQVQVFMHWPQGINSKLKSKLRVYLWQLYDDEPIEMVVSKMFDKETDGNCLLFQQLTISAEIQHSYLQETNSKIPNMYFIHNCQLPNSSLAILSERMILKVLNHCQKLGKIKGIYTYPNNQYVVQFDKMEDVQASFFEVRDDEDRLVIFMIGAIVGIGNIVLSPNLVNLDKKKGEYEKQKSQPEINQNRGVKDLVIHEQKKTEDLVTNQNEVKLEKKHKQQTIDTKGEENSANYRQKLQDQEEKGRREKQKMFMKHKGQQLVKQSFAVIPNEKIRGNRKRTKSQQIIHYDPQEEEEEIDFHVIREMRGQVNFQVKLPKKYEEKSIDFNKKILNIDVSSDEKQLYLLFKDSFIICDIENFKNKKVYKFDPLDDQNLHLPTPMIIYNKQTMTVFAHESYLYWINFTANQAPDWKYVQRKQIYAIEVIEQLNLLMVGGKNFSKLSYLGKSTQRSNIKVYSCGKTGKRDHLFTYDIPECQGENVLILKYISTKPNGTKLLLAGTSQNKLFFFRVKGYNNIEIYSCIQCYEIGIQQIVSMNYFRQTSILVCLQKLSQDLLCFKYLKVNCSYQKVQVATECIKLPVGSYTQFRIGGKGGEEWITATDSSKKIYSFYLQKKQPKISTYEGNIKEYILLKHGIIYRQNSAIKCQMQKN